MSINTQNNEEQIESFKKWSAYVCTALFTLSMSALLLSGPALDNIDSSRAEQDSASAHYPTKPSLEQQIAYREDEREQLRLNQIIVKSHATTQ